MGAFYNELDAYPAQWLRNLSAAGHIAPGVVDERSIRDVRAGDLASATQAHFFAGIGVWSYALRLAGWPDDEPVWTGSCPCQPFSVAGKQRGTDDERHLWPEWFRLIRECRPPHLFGGSDPVWLPCRDGRLRPAQPGAFPLAHGTAGRMALVRAVGGATETHFYNRVGALRGLGNAIVPQAAAVFLRAFLTAGPRRMWPKWLRR